MKFAHFRPFFRGFSVAFGTPSVSLLELVASEEGVNTGLACLWLTSELALSEKGDSGELVVLCRSERVKEKKKEREDKQ